MFTRPLILLAPDAPATAGAPPKPAATPSPTPAASPAPPPAPSPSPSPTEGDDAGVDEILSDLNKTFDAAGAEPAKGAPPKPEGGGKPSPAAPASSPKPAEDAPAPAPTPGEPKTPQELREAYKRARTELDDHKKTVGDLQTKIAQFERQRKDADALKALLAKEQKEKSDAQAELRVLKREDSPEFKKEYVDPYFEAAGEAAEYVEKLQKTDGTPANFKQDFNPVYWLLKNSTGAKAVEKAEELFGEKEAPFIIRHAQEILRLDRRAEKARNQERTRTEQELKEREGKTIQERDALKTQNDAAWKQLKTDLQSKVQDYHDSPDDKEAAEYRAKAYSWLDKPFDASPATRERLAHMYHMAASFWPHKLKLRRQENEIAALKKQLEGARPKPPGGGGKPTGGEPGTEEKADTIDSWAAGARKMVDSV